MSETPERKVLKEMMQKLKEKAIKSETRLLETNLRLFDEIGRLWKIMTDLLDADKVDTGVSGLLALELRSLHKSIEASSDCSKVALEDFKLYVDTLEQYSLELDKTLAGIFEEAKKIAEEEQKKQEELRKKQEEMRKRKPSYRA